MLSKVPPTLAAEQIPGSFDGTCVPGLYRVGIGDSEDAFAAYILLRGVTDGIPEDLAFRVNEKTQAIVWSQCEVAVNLLDGLDPMLIR